MHLLFPVLPRITQLPEFLPEEDQDPDGYYDVDGPNDVERAL